MSTTTKTPKPGHIDVTKDSNYTIQVPGTKFMYRGRPVDLTDIHPALAERIAADDMGSARFLVKKAAAGKAGDK